MDTIKKYKKLITGLKKYSKGVGLGGLIMSGGILYILFFLLQFLFVASVGLSTIGLAISLFSGGSILLGLLVLFIVAPLAIGFAYYFFIFLLIFTILALIIWGIIYLFGFDVSFDSVWGTTGFIVKVAVMSFLAFMGITGFIEAIKRKKLLEFFKEYWLGILIFLFLFWLFFL